MSSATSIGSWSTPSAGLLLFLVIGCSERRGEPGGAGPRTTPTTGTRATPITTHVARVEYRRIGEADPGLDSTDLATRWRPVDTSPEGRGGAASSVWLASLPDGVAKRRYILDCTGCHQLNETRVFRGDSRRSAAEWAADAGRMIGFAGSETRFPVISHDAHPESLAALLAGHLPAEPPADAARSYAALTTPGAGHPGGTAPTASGAGANGTPVTAQLTEYQLPVAPDLPHDLAISKDGTVLVTGMFTHQIYRIDPDSGVVGAVPIPVEKANPRAIEIDDRGDWWILCGGPQTVARYEPDHDRWSSFPIGMYPHSIAPSADGSRIWFNGHFTRDPELIGWLDPSSGKVTTIAAPIHPALGPMPGGPIPYEARLAPNGVVWISELQGNRMVGYDPAGDAWRAVEMPTFWSGPRRFDIGPDGVIWIPAYAAGTLVRFDPASSDMEEIDLPIPDSVPYVVRVHPTTGHVWIGTAAADVVYRFDPAARRFDVMPIPTRGASMRHMAIDPASGDVWVAYGASPAIHPARVARIRLTSN